MQTGNAWHPYSTGLERAGCRNVQVLADQERLQDMEGRMDLVLVDAPCTGSGTWRRRSDAKWRLTAQQLAQRISEQKSILADAARYVRPGGRLVYVTCSIFPSENDDQVAAFLNQAASFTLTDPQEMWSQAFPDHIDAVHLTQHGCLLTPRRTNTDGFFLSALVKDGSGEPI